MFKSAVEKIGKYIDWLTNKWKEFKKWLGLDVEKKQPKIKDIKTNDKASTPSNSSDIIPSVSTPSSSPAISIKPKVQPITQEDIAAIVPSNGLPFKATPDIPQDSIKAINEKLASLRAELEVQVIGSEKYNQLKQ